MFSPLWAIHIADGILGTPWLVAGWLVAILLVGLAAWRVREEEIPRIALLTAAFFVASSIHVKFGPSSVHLLLNGLVGVILGRRAPLAILVGVTLQALLIAHGGLTTVGINTSIQAIPALAAGGLFHLLCRWTTGERGWPRSLVIAAGALAWGTCLTLGMTMLIVNPWRDLVQISSQAGLVFSVERFAEVQNVAGQPIVLGLLGLFVMACVILARRSRLAPEFPAGALAGLAGVLGTLVLAGAILLLDGADRWEKFVNVVFIAHLPLALLEAGIVGVTVGFLARVQPDMIGASVPALPRPSAASVGATIPPLLAIVVLLLFSSNASAHRLTAQPVIDLKARQVVVESFYETGKLPQEGEARVLRADLSILAEGPLDAHGKFRFSYTQPEALSIVVTAPGGHRAVIALTASQLGGVDETAPAEPARLSDEGTRWRDLLSGLSVVLALGAFVLSWRNARSLRKLTECTLRGEK